MPAVSQYTSGKAVVLSINDTILSAAKAMQRKNIGSVVVADNQNKLVGVVTDRDITCYAVAEGLDIHTKLSELLLADQEALTIDENETIDRALELMAEMGIRRLPVTHTTKQGRTQCIGIVSLDDLIVKKEVDVDTLADIVKSQVYRLSRNYAWRPYSERRKNQKESEFYAQMARIMNVDKVTAEKVSMSILSNICKRITFSEAADFISQLPRNIQSSLLSLKAGPDTSITAQIFIKDVSSIMDIDDAAAEEVFPKFWQGLSKFLKLDDIDQGELKDLLSQLPKNIEKLFGTIIEEKKAS